MPLSKMDLDSLVNQFVGKSFKINCAKIQVLGDVDHEPPVFCGPGIINSDGEGEIAYTVFDEGHSRFQDARQLIRKKIVERSFFRVFAEDYDGNEWSGHWHMPSMAPSLGHRILISGQFSQLSTHIEGASEAPCSDEVCLYYAEPLRLPYREWSHSTFARRGEVCETRRRRDSASIDVAGSNVRIELNEEGKITTVSCTLAKDWAAPHCEASLANTINFISASPVRPRLWVRVLPRRTNIFVRTARSGLPTGMPRPLIGRAEHSDAFCNILRHFLLYCRKNGGFDPSDLENLVHEIILASTGTLHAFALSLSVAIEGLTRLLCPTGRASSRFPAKLLDYVKAWPDDPSIAAAAVQRLSGGALPRVDGFLSELNKRGIVTDRQIAIWNKVRQPLAHGEPTNYQSTETLADRNTLIAMFYQMLYAIIGYRGMITDHESATWEPLDFQWEA
jgi:hypothetical protein